MHSYANKSITTTETIHKKIKEKNNNFFLDISNEIYAKKVSNSSKRNIFRRSPKERIKKKKKRKIKQNKRINL